ncbi:hypothetical protein N825_27640 [Skermanella stibiiresistens SB22]|uniref:Uncharacterized protein n=1 Tax=Skermanella stibiiresistens SB22 TaxID=1385369 RepID=W9H5I4_9PROT|nr:hypothetical protein [Skermanella stibiiresistens]EWY41495.1 hypothetical protein N825_27640 [Skermanella stibiiresistens SB22]
MVLAVGSQQDHPIGWNIASLFSDNIREQRDRLLFNDLKGPPPSPAGTGKP